jgi:hypothetical protein
MSPNNPYGGFNPQTANFLQQQRFAAFQRQMQEMGQMQGVNRNMQFPPSSANINQPPSTVNENTNSVNTNTLSENSSNSKSSTPTPAKQENLQQQQQQLPPQAQQQTTPQPTGKASPQISKETKSAANDAAIPSTPNKVSCF